MEAEICIVIGKKGEFYKNSPFEKEMATYLSILACDRENTVPSPPTDRGAWEATLHEVAKESDRT